MSEQRFIRNIMGNIYDSKTDKWFEEDWKGKPLGYDDDLIVFLNKQQATITHLEKVNGKNFAKRRLLEQDNLVLRNENEQLRQEIERLKKELDEKCP